MRPETASGLLTAPLHVAALNDTLPDHIAKKAGWFNWFMLLALLLMSAVLPRTGLAADWTYSGKVYTSKPNENLNAAIYGNNMFVAVGNNGTILVSNDGITWIDHNLNTSAALYGVTYGNGMFVAAGAGAIYTSTDAVTWTSQTNAGGAVLRAVTYANNLFVAVGSQGTILTSSNGATWAPQTSNTSQQLLGITYGAGNFVAMGDGVNLTSSDGMNWTSQASDAATYTGVAFNGKTFATVASNGGTKTSSDGSAWTASANSVAAASGIIYGHDMFVAVGNVSGSQVYMSTDGVGWYRQGTGYANPLYAAAYGNGVYVAVGSSGMILYSYDPQVKFTKRLSGTSNNLSGIAYGNGTYAAVGQLTSTNSGDGTSWTIHDVNPIAGYDDVVFGGGTFVSVGFSGAISTSSDGASWTPRTSGTTNWLHSVGYGNGSFIAAGENGTILTSSDGSTWTSHGFGTTAFFGVAYGSGLFVLTGLDGNIFTSSDGGVSWTNRASAAAGLLGVKFVNGMFVAVGLKGIILTSTDGLAWTERFIGNALQFLYGVAYGNGIFMAVGNYNNVSDFVVTSLDGITWNARTTNVNSKLSDVTFVNGRFTVVGDGGEILQYANPDLLGLSLSGGSLSPAFSPDVTSYAASVVNTVSSITVTPTIQDVGATVTVNGTAVASGSASGPISLNEGSNTITVVGTGQDGTTTKTYTVMVWRATSNANLSTLSLEVGSLSPAFAQDVINYTADVASNVTHEVVFQRTVDGAARVFVNGHEETYPMEKWAILLNAGSNTIKVDVTAPDGVTKKTYTVIVTKAAVVNAAPVAGDVYIDGTAQVGTELAGYYSYTDAESDPEDSSTFRWMSDMGASGATKTAIGGATAPNYTPVAGDAGKYLFFCVTPVATTGTPTGSEVCSSGLLVASSGKVSQTITFGPAPTVAVGGTGTVRATASSGLGVSFSSLTTGVCTVSGSTVTGVTRGDCIIAADQAGDGTYDPAARVTQTIAVGKRGQSITFGAAPSVPVGGSGTVSARASSGLDVTLDSLTSGVCTVSGSVVSGVAAGTCIIAADQAGDDTYNPAPRATQSFGVGSPVPLIAPWALLGLGAALAGLGAGRARRIVGADRA